MTNCSEANPRTEGLPGLETFCSNTGTLDSWLSPPPPPNPVQNSTFSARSVLLGKEGVGGGSGNGQPLAPIMWKEIHSKNKNVFNVSSQTHRFRSGCPDNDVAFRQAARDCFSPSRSFTQQTPTEALPLARPGIKR